jgi:hypothetical protein
MSRIEDLFKVIESHEFAAIMNLASDLKTFVRALGADASVQALAREMSVAGARAAVHDRILALVKDVGEEGYEHPWDSALAAYLWLLAERDAAQAKASALRISETPQCWWAAKVAEKIIATDKGNGPEPFPGTPVQPPADTGGAEVPRR